MPTGDTAIIVPIPAAEPLVDRWRARFDKHAAQGVPAHITLLSPFVPRSQLAAALPVLREILAGPPPDLSFDRLDVFPGGPDAHGQPRPGLAVLTPRPGDWFLDRSRALCQRFGLLPYGGRYGADVHPHLTVAYGSLDRAEQDARFAAIAADLAPNLPLCCRPRQARVMVRDGEPWRVYAAIPLTGTSAGSEPPLPR